MNKPKLKVRHFIMKRWPNHGVRAKCNSLPHAIWPTINNNNKKKSNILEIYVENFDFNLNKTSGMESA